MQFGALLFLLSMGQPDGQTTAAAASMPAYVVRIEDQLDVTVFGQPSLSKVLEVLPDGSIDLPLAGRFLVAGKSTNEISRQVKRRLSEYLVDPHVSVGIAHRAILRASAVGAVKLPGMIEFRDGWRLRDLIASAGGLTVERPEWAEARILHASGESEKVDLLPIMTGDDPEKNLIVQPNDVLVIQALDSGLTHVQVLGEVQKPGPVEAPSDGSISAVLSAAGGATLHAALYQATIVHHNVSRVVDLSGLSTGSLPADAKVEPGDLVFIPEIKARYAVIGAVRLPGSQDCPQGKPISLMQALANAGGNEKDADLKHAELLHLGPDGKVHAAKLDLDQMMRSGSAELFQTIHPDEVLFIPSKGNGNGGVHLTDLFAVASFLAVLK